MRGGVLKEVMVSQGAVTMELRGHDQIRHVDDDFDTILCNASINFNLLGRPSPPPVSLTATLWGTTSASPTGFSSKGIREFLQIPAAP